MPRPWRAILPLSLVLLASWSLPAAASGAWPWPAVGPVLRAFESPSSPYGPGHRGIDIAVPVGTPVLAPAAGVVSFAGPVGGELFVTIDHGGGLETTYSWLSAKLARKGDSVTAGQAIASSGTGHPGSTIPHLHLGVRLGGEYVDPMDYLSPASVVDLIRLAPLVPPGST